jgi:H+/Cl- antiporter ClcA
MIESLFSHNAENIWLAIPGVAGGLIAGMCLMLYRSITVNGLNLQDPDFTEENGFEIESVKTTVFWLGVMVLGSVLSLLTIIGGASIAAAAASIGAGLALGACVERAIWLTSRNSRDNGEQGHTRWHGQIGHGFRYLISFRWLL